jgi:hypothetical protein
MSQALIQSGEERPKPGVKHSKAFDLALVLAGGFGKSIEHETVPVGMLHCQDRGGKAI